MKIILLILFVGLLSSPAFSQKPNKNSKESLDSLYAQDIREIRATFPDMEVHEHKDSGEYEYQYITHYLKTASINYPPYAREHGIQGKVDCRFIINKNGKISDIKIIRGIGGGCDEECLRVLSALALLNPDQGEIGIHGVSYEKFQFTFVVQ